MVTPPGRPTSPPNTTTAAAPRRTAPSRSPSAPPAPSASDGYDGTTPARSGGAARAVIRPGSPDEGRRLMDDMMRGLPANSPIRGRALAASRSFSTEQLRRMHAAGVRFADIGGVPSTRLLEGSNSERPLRTPGRYLPSSRVVQMRDTASTGKIRHEMAHAWDEVRNDRLQLRDDASQVERRRTMLRLNHQDARGQLPSMRRRAQMRRAGSPERAAAEAQIRSVDRETRGVAAGFHSDTALQGAFEAYRGRMMGRPRDQGLEYAAREGHALRSAREFYAEGFNAFHANSHSRERVRQTAPELYRVLHREATQHGTLPTAATPPD